MCDSKRLCTQSLTCWWFSSLIVGIKNSSSWRPSDYQLKSTAPDDNPCTPIVHAVLFWLKWQPTRRQHMFERARRSPLNLSLKMCTVINDSSWTSIVSRLKTFANVWCSFFMFFFFVSAFKSFDFESAQSLLIYICKIVLMLRSFSYTKEIYLINSLNHFSKRLSMIAGNILVHVLSELKHWSRHW